MVAGDRLPGDDRGKQEWRGSEKRGWRKRGGGKRSLNRERWKTGGWEAEVKKEKRAVAVGGTA